MHVVAIAKLRVQRTARLVDAIALLTKAPRTQGELARLVGASSKSVRVWIRLLQDEGKVAPDGTRKDERKRGVSAIIWRWQG